MGFSSFQAWFLLVFSGSLVIFSGFNSGFFLV